MYRIYADQTCIYDDVTSLDNELLLEPVFSQEDNTSGSLEFLMPPNNSGYNSISRMSSDIVLYKNGKPKWQGRILTESIDFWNNKRVMCEGTLAFLNDTIQTKRELKGLDISGFLQNIISEHNLKVSANRQFKVGKVTVTLPNGPTDWYVDYESTYHHISEYLLNPYGGHIQIRLEVQPDGKTIDRYIDYVVDYQNRNSQKIEFGQNLLDFTRSWDMSDFVTAVVPFGADIEGADGERLTVASVNDGKISVVSSSANTYGYIEKVLDLSDIDDPNVLLQQSKDYLSKVQFDNLVIELSAVDLHFLDNNIEDIELLDELQLISTPHGMDRTFPVTRVEIPLDRPEDSRFRLGENVKNTFTSISNTINTELIEELKKGPDTSYILDQAKQNAAQIIQNATNGYITITTGEFGTNELYISNDRDYSKAGRYWRWNIDGLGYFDKTLITPTNPSGLKLAMTMDGQINADFITTGRLNAGIVSTGILQDIKKNVVFNLDTGEFIMKKGQINLGNGNFVVDTNGDVKMNGDILLSGNIVWTSKSTPCQAVYSRNNITKPTNGWMYNDVSKFPNYSTTSWHKIMDSYDYYVSYTYDGGATWTNTVMIRGKNGTNGTNGRDGKDGKDGTDAAVTSQNVFNALTSDGTKFGCFGDEYGRLYINAQFIRGGVIQASYGSNKLNITENGLKFVDAYDRELWSMGISGGRFYMTSYDTYFDLDVARNINLSTSSTIVMTAANGVEMHMGSGNYWEFTGGGINYCNYRGQVINRVMLEQ